MLFRSLWVLLSVAGRGTCCSATRRGRDGGGRDCVPVMGVSEGGIVLNDVVEVALLKVGFKVA